MLSGFCSGAAIVEGYATRYVEFFLDGADGYYEFCERFLFYAPGMRDEALDQLCGA